MGCYELRCVVVTFVGWYEGERVRDCERGSSPSEVESEQVRARNLKQRCRLLALCGVKQD